MYNYQNAYQQGCSKSFIQAKETFFSANGMECMRDASVINGISLWSLNMKRVTQTRKKEVTQGLDAISL